MARSLVSDLAGRVLAGRYLLHSAIGTGASGRVYVADDTRLRRRVAVKVLHAALAEDTAFLRRFRAEAQVAASLHHPHIVTVYDWGEDDVPFMVLELLEGGSLRSMLDQGDAAHRPAGRARRPRRRGRARVRARARHPAPRHQAREPAVRRARHRARRRLRSRPRARRGELDRARGRGVRHRALRVARAGDGRAARRAAPTSTRSRSCSSSRSPARVPFSADTTIGMLTARTQRPLTAPDELGPLAPVVERAGRIDADERYPDAATMRAALADVGDALPPPAPLRARGHDRPRRPAPDPHAAPGRDRALFDQDATRTPVVVGRDGPARATTPASARAGSCRSSSRAVLVLAIVLARRSALAQRAAARAPVEVPGARRLHRRRRPTRAGRRRRASTSTVVASASTRPIRRARSSARSRAAARSPTTTTGRARRVRGPAPVAVPTIVGPAAGRRRERARRRRLRAGEADARSSRDTVADRAS